MTLTFFAAGVPQPQGSTKGYVKRRADGTAYAAITSDNVKLKPWRESVAWSALEATKAAGVAVWSTGPVTVEARFLLRAPKAIQRRMDRRIPQAHLTKPDLDKLARGLLDALTGVLFEDDSQVVALRVTKEYASLGVRLGVSMRVTFPEGGQP